ncbi:hypothetical protein LCGC14_0764390, partial [marine sediment metagenome]
PSFYYFFGSPEEIYRAFLKARKKEGHPVDKPKYAWFGVGWEAFGALAWNTDHITVADNIDTYLEYGYPLKWMVVGSGFWPSKPDEFNEIGNPNHLKSASQTAKKLQSTTSFGMWDETKYPDPKKFVDYFHQKGILFTIGLRIGFVPGGPFTDEGLEQGYFLKTGEGEEILGKPGFPTVPVYYLDTKNPEAVAWYVALCQKWLDYGVDGFKEDLYGFSTSILQDDFVDVVNHALMDKGVYIMGRNNYLGSPVDIHRYNDFNFSQIQDRGPINGLAYAFSGFPNVYPDIVGGTGLASESFGPDKEKKKVYLVRYAQYAALNPSMSFGFGPWNYGAEVNRLCLEAAKLHDRLHPYFYSNAIKAYQTGFPHTMIPLPLAFPQDENVYGLANTDRRSYEWMIGDALLAAPLYGDDYETAVARSIYLPEGIWMDYDTGKTYQGPLTLEGFKIPLDKTPLFVGGTGIVIEEVEKKLRVRVYPIKENTETIFYGKDGETKSVITIGAPDWENFKVTDTTNGKVMVFSKVRHAFEFDLEPGHNYLIE